MAKRIKEMTPEEIEAELQYYRIKRDRRRRLGAVVGAWVGAGIMLVVLIVVVVALSYGDGSAG